MAIKVKKFNVRVGDIVYSPGDVIHELNEAEEQRLVDDGYCEFPANVASTQADKDPAADPETVEQFKELNATGQKEFLKKQEIEPGSNETERIQQFVQWLEGKQKQDDTEDDLDSKGGGPNTGLPINN